MKTLCSNPRRVSPSFFLPSSSSSNPLTPLPPPPQLLLLVWPCWQGEGVFAAQALTMPLAASSSVHSSRAGRNALAFLRSRTHTHSNMQAGDRMVAGCRRRGRRFCPFFFFNLPGRKGCSREAQWLETLSAASSAVSCATSIHCASLSLSRFLSTSLSLSLSLALFFCLCLS